MSMDDCDAMEMIDKLNEEHDKTFQLNADLHLLNQKLKRADKRHRYNKRDDNENMNELKSKHEYEIECLKDFHSDQLINKESLLEENRQMYYANLKYQDTNKNQYEEILKLKLYIEKYIRK
jgi:hypothetical protein